MSSMDWDDPQRAYIEVTDIRGKKRRCYLIKPIVDHDIMRVLGDKETTLTCCSTVELRVADIFFPSRDIARIIVLNRLY